MIKVLHRSQPVSPRNVSVLNQDCFIFTVITQAFEEDPTSQGRDLKRLDVQVNAEVVPCVYSDRVRDQARYNTIEVEEEEDC